MEGEQTKLGIGNDLFDNAKNIKRIIAPAENAYKKIEEIIKLCKKLDSDTLFLCALGPTATVLSYRLAKLGYQSIDIGHIDIDVEDMLLVKREMTLPTSCCRRVI